MLSRDEINDENIKNLDDKKWGPPFEKTKNDLLKYCQIQNLLHGQ